MGAPLGTRPIALGHHRYQWLYVVAFVHPVSGKTVWYVANGIDKAFFERLLADFARTTGAGRHRIIILVLDNAGWHTLLNLAVPEGTRLVYLPPCTPEIQPAERLWLLVDEPIVNRFFDTIDELDDAIAQRCRVLHRTRNLIAQHTHFHCWPKPLIPS